MAVITNQHGCYAACRGPAAEGIVVHMYTYGAPRVGNKVGFRTATLLVLAVSAAFQVLGCAETVHASMQKG